MGSPASLFDGYAWLSLTLGNFPMEILFFLFYENLYFYVADAGSQKEKDNLEIPDLVWVSVAKQVQTLNKGHLPSRVLSNA